MKRLHVHLKVSELEQSIGFYSALFGKAPDKREADYAKWMVENPAANISISNRSGSGSGGVDHVGIQFDNDVELEEIAGRLKAANAEIAPEADATCCYARSNKVWARSPEGAVWELFHSFGDSATYDAKPALADATHQSAACCAAAE